jgi:hypothetical protein
MINGIAAGENYSRIIGDFYLLLAKFLRGYSLYPYKWMKIKIYIILFCQLKVG